MNLAKFHAEPDFQGVGAVKSRPSEFSQFVEWAQPDVRRRGTVQAGENLSETFHDTFSSREIFKLSQLSFSLHG